MSGLQFYGKTEMTTNPQLFPPYTSKLTQFDKFQRDLSRLKHHLKMKRRIYDETQFTNINQRIKQCEAYFKKEKYQLMRKEADKILADGHRFRNNVYDEVKNKLELSRKIRAKPYVVASKDRKEERFNINLKSEQSSMSDDRVVMEYDLTPASEPKNMKIISKSRVRTMGDEKRSNERYVSDFERKIKAQLSKIPMNRLNRYSQFGQPDHEEPRYHKHSGIKLAPLGYSEPPVFSKKIERSRRENYSVLQSIPSDRYFNLNERIIKSRVEFNERQKKQIDRVSRDKMGWIEKSRVLKDMYSRYGNKSQYGDEDALDLMSKANLARADVILSKEETE